jgi:hypothetical protein
MTKKSDYQKQRDTADTSSRGRRARKTVWDDAEIVVNIECTKPGTALDDYLRAHTRVVPSATSKIALRIFSWRSRPLVAVAVLMLDNRRALL